MQRYSNARDIPTTRFLERHAIQSACVCFDVQRPVTTKHLTRCVHCLHRSLFDPSAFVVLVTDDFPSLHQCFAFDCYPLDGFDVQAVAEAPSGVADSLQLECVQADDDETLEKFRACLEEVLKARTLENMRAREKAL